MGQIDSLKTGKKFKNTEIGEIPVYWEVSKLEKLISLKYGEGLPENEREGKPYPVYGSNGIVGYHSKFLVNGPGIIVGRKGSIGSITWSDRDFWPIDTTYYVTTDLNKTNFRWLFYYLIHLRLDRLNAATGIPGLNRQVALETKIAIPPLPEQKKIAEILSTVDEAIEKSDEIIEKTKEIKKGLMQELLTSGIGHKKFKKTEIGEIPVDWEVVRMGDICNVVGGSTPSTNKKEYWNGDILWAVPTDITKIKGNVISNTEKKITKAGLSACAAKLLPEGSILLTSRATIGACAINTKPMATNQGFASLICKANVHNWFIFYKIVSMRKELKRLGSGSTFKETSKKSIRAIKIPLLPVHEQKKIAEILASVDEKIEKETANKEKLEQTKKGLMQVLLTGKKRV